MSNRVAKTPERYKSSKPMSWLKPKVSAPVERPPGKGDKDGKCNREACQAPLKGREQWWMRSYSTTDGRLYYCGECARMFNDSDRKFREPQRCIFDADADMRESLA